MDYRDRFLIIDDCLFSKAEADEIENYFTSDLFPWYIVEHGNYTSTREMYDYFSSLTGSLQEQYQMSHIFVRNQKVNSDMAKPNFILSRVQEKYNLPIVAIERVKSNLCSRMCNAGFQTPHVDYYGDHLVLLYYVNDSDGDTILFNEVLYNEEDMCKVRSLTVSESVQAKKGRVAIFNGCQLHSGSFPKNNPFRIVINFDLLL